MCDAKAITIMLAFFLFIRVGRSTGLRNDPAKKSCIRIIFKNGCYRIIIAEIIKWLQVFTEELYLCLL